MIFRARGASRIRDIDRAHVVNGHVVNQGAGAISRQMKHVALALVWIIPVDVDIVDVGIAGETLQEKLWTTRTERFVAR